MVINWWWLALSIVMFICFISCFVYPVRNIKKQFKQACFWTWYMKKSKDTLTDDDINSINWREWNSIFNQISLCWMFGSMSLLVFAAFLWLALGVLN